MLVVKDITVLEVRSNRVNVEIYTSPLYGDEVFIPPKKSEVTTEMVYGAIYTNFDDKQICIGMTEKVQKAIGLPFKAFDDQRKEIKRLNDKYDRCKKMMDKQSESFIDMQIFLNKFSRSFWKRLKFLFTGKYSDKAIYQEMHILEGTKERLNAKKDIA